ncbi:conjugal transfer protein TraX [Acinetobacter indicus]|uniref:TraX family protein n=1 Tax=Acinetobacter TaxID=469 RepID=UPI0015D0D9D1|nr:conjugal transfer protein TraX [Acinetobacter indicus]
MRIKELDLIKWLAIIFMVIDHLRFLDVIDSVGFGLYSVGRLAFPLFCFVLAYNFFRTEGQFNTEKSDFRYISSLLIFFLVSELPYRFFGEMQFNSMNIMLTLALSFTLLYAFIRDTRALVLEPSFVCLLVVLTTIGLELTDNFKVQYGIGGVFLPLAMYFALREKKFRYFFWVIFCAGFMNLDFQGGGLFNSFNAFLLSIIPMVASIIGALLPFLIIQSNIKMNISPIKKWGYYFYPVHFIVLGVARMIYRMVL